MSGHAESEWLDCQRNEFFPKQKGIPSLVKIEHKNTATLDSARSKKKSKVAVLQLPAHPASFAYNFVWDAQFLFQPVPGCNSIADLSLKIVFWTSVLENQCHKIIFYLYK